MGAASKRLERRREAKRELDELFRQPNMVNVVHYSCESFYDRVDGSSPRITSIAVRNMGSRQTVSFSIHQIAEERKMGLDLICQCYDKLEKEALDRFYQCIRASPNYIWMHWNMRDTNYGFPAVEHRYRVLGGDPVHISDRQLFDLATKLIEIHGPAYAPHSRLANILDINGMSKKDFLLGADEAEAFKRKDYARLHQSTLRKVDVIHHLAEREWDGSLRTLATWQDQYGTTIGGMIEAVTDHWLFKLLGGIGIVASIISLLSLFHR